MTKPVDLGELEFKAGDFTCNCPQDTAHWDWCEARYNVDIANEILQDKLKKAQICYGRLDPQDNILKFIGDPNVVSKTHVARLVCIKKIK